MGAIILDEGAAPSTPSTGDVALYAKTDSVLYYKDDTGTETALGGIATGTPIATTSGSNHDFTGFPSGTKRITVMADGVSSTSTGVPLIQLGDSGGIETTGYLSSAGFVSSGSSGAAQGTSGFLFTSASAASSVFGGTLVLTLLDSSSNTWSAFGVFGRSDSAVVNWTGGTKSLSGELTQIRLTLSSGNFDAGSINILYE